MSEGSPSGLFAMPVSSQAPSRLFAQLDAHTESNFFSGYSGKLADGGLFVTTYAALEVGEHVEVDVSLPGNQFVRVQGSVVWRRTPVHGSRELSPGVGIVLHALSEDQAELFETFMHLREPTFADPDALSCDLPVRDDVISRLPCIETQSAPPVTAAGEPDAPRARRSSRRDKRSRKRGRR